MMDVVDLPDKDLGVVEERAHKIQVVEEDHPLVPAVIIDNGTALTKVGLSTEQLPSATFPTLVGISKDDEEDVVVGKISPEQRGFLVVKIAVGYGISADFEALEKIWRHTFVNALSVNPEDHPVLITETPLNPRHIRAMMTQVIFDELGVPSMMVATQAVLSLYASCRTMGVIIDFGAGITDIVPILEGFALPHTICRLDITGDDLDLYLAKMLEKKGNFILSPDERMNIRGLKEAHCYVAKNVANGHETVADGKPAEGPLTFTHASGKEVELSEELAYVGEVFFKPSLIGKSGLQSLHRYVHQAVSRLENQHHRDIYGNIVLAGGGAQMKGLKSRIQQELSTLLQGIHRVRIDVPKGSAYSAWCGGAILASAAPFRKMWVTKEEYLEHGPEIIHKKCF